MADDVTISMVDFGGATAEQGAKADSAVQGIRGNGTIISPDDNKIVTVTPDAIGAVPTSRTINGYSLANNITLTPSDIGAAEVNTYTTTIGTDWTTAETGEYTQTILIPGILETDNPIVDVILDASKDVAIQQLEAWGCISKIEIANGNITVTCLENMPEVAIPIQLKAVR